MSFSVVSVALVMAVGGTAQAAARDGAIKKEEIEYQKQAFRQWWDTDLVWTYDDLPKKGSVPGDRTPYAGHDYPDRGGGTVYALRKYDSAFHSRQMLATDFERKDVGGHRTRWARNGRLRLFGRRRIPGWYGHCNGWTAAAMRHAEPRINVTRNGVVFTPADIKGLLAEIYMYSDTEFLGGIDPVINPGTFHVILGNWLGNGKHPIGMETALGEVVFNYPIYSYASSFNKAGDDQVEVKLNVRYTMSTGQEYDKSPDNNRVKYFHYTLDLDSNGGIVGGRYYRDSERIDMLWAPLQPTQGGKEGNERGNPHIDVKEVLAIWRASVPEENRAKWLNIDPTEADRVELAEVEQTVDQTVAKAATDAETPLEESTEDAGENR